MNKTAEKSRDIKQVNAGQKSLTLISCVGGRGGGDHTMRSKIWRKRKCSFSDNNKTALMFYTALGKPLKNIFFSGPAIKAFPIELSS